MNVAVIMPARLKSTRLPDKLLLDRTGRTVLAHTIERAVAAQRASQGLISRVLVAADDPQLLAEARRCGVAAVLTRADHQSGTDRIAEAAEQLEEQIIVNLQADEPEVKPAYICAVARLLTSGEESDPMATLAAPIFDDEKWHKPNVVKVVLGYHGHALYFSRAPIPHLREQCDAACWKIDGRRVYGLHHLGIYAYRREFLLGYRHLPPSRLEKLERLEQLRAVEAGHRIKVGLVEQNPPGIDTPEEYQAFVQRCKTVGLDSDEKLVIRDVCLADIPALARIHYNEARHRDVLATADGKTLRYVTLERDGKLIGFGTLILAQPPGWKPIVPHFPMLHDLVVRVDLRSQGYGRRLVKGMEEAARSHGFCETWLGVDVVNNRRAQRLYQKLGYEQFDRQPIIERYDFVDSSGFRYTGVEHLVHMRKKLS